MVISNIFVYKIVLDIWIFFFIAEKVYELSWLSKSS